MPYMSVIAPCFLCGVVFASNPSKVPSVDNQPICESCMERVQEARKRQGMRPFPVPPGAYDGAEEVS